MTYIIAEAGVNHNGDLGIAIELIKQAKLAGADCIKFQTFKADRIVTQSSPKAKYQLLVTDENESQYEMLKKLEMDFDDYQALIQTCEEEGIDFLSTPYNVEDADFLDSLGVDGYKIASGQLVEISFLQNIARRGNKMILSTGMATLAEVAEAVEAVRATGNENIVVLQCTTNYPSRIEDANIRAMNTIRDACKVAVGYSDHVENNFACYAAVALGATIIEKHFTLDRSMPGPDHSSSLMPDELAALVSHIRNIEKSLGDGIKRPTQKESENAYGMKRSLVVVQDIPAGTILEEKHIGFKRPFNGLSPNMLYHVIGKQVAVDMSKDQPITYASITW